MRNHGNDCTITQSGICNCVTVFRTGSAEPKDKTVPNAHDTTHVVKVYCDVCDQMAYQKVKLGEPIVHNCLGISNGLSVTICAWEYEDDAERYNQRGDYSRCDPQKGTHSIPHVGCILR